MTSFALATAHQLSTEAGCRAVQAGGNALDAALAAAASLAVALPDNCGLGGDLIALVRSPDGQITTVNASGWAADATDPQALREESGLSMPSFGARAITVPGILRGWEAIWKLGATRPWSDLFTDALAQARSGVPTPPSVAESLRVSPERLSADPGIGSVFFPDGKPLAVGQPLVQERLAETLEAVAKDGATAFYRGSIGASLLTTIGELGSPLAADDLADFEVETVAPLVSQLSGVEVVTAPPNSQGALLLMTLALIEGRDPRLDPLAAEAPALAAIFRRVARARAAHLADPRFASVPVEEIIGGSANLDSSRATAERRGTGDTVALVAAERNGWAISLIQSLFSAFGSGVMDPATGIIAHNRGSFFSLDPDSPNVIAPRKRPAHTLAPTMIVADGRLQSVLGTMGGLAQTQILTQLMLHLRAGDTAGQAVARPRWILGGLGMDGDPGTVQAEARVPGAAVRALKRRWNAIGLPDLSLEVGDSQVITVENGEVLTAASDPRGVGGSTVIDG